MFGSAKCAKCNKTVYAVERLSVLDKSWHKFCFKCHVCNTTLNVKNFQPHEGLPYCKAHVPCIGASEDRQKKGDGFLLSFVFVFHRFIFNLYCSLFSSYMMSVGDWSVCFDSCFFVIFLPPFFHLYWNRFFWDLSRFILASADSDPNYKAGVSPAVQLDMSNYTSGGLVHTSSPPFISYRTHSGVPAEEGSTLDEYQDQKNPTEYYEEEYYEEGEWYVDEEYQRPS